MNQATLLTAILSLALAGCSSPGSSDNSVGGDALIAPTDGGGDITQDPEITTDSTEEETHPEDGSPETKETDGPCEPDCDNKNCGGDGCGGFCGACSPDQACEDGQCQCIEGCDGKECGSDGCDGTCGVCAENESCEDFACVCPSFTCGDVCCGEEGCTPANRRRLIKWITPYSAPGRWLIDLSQEIVPLAAGGEFRIVAQHGDNNVGPYTYRYTVDLRFSKRADGLRPVALETLITQGGYKWNESFHEQLNQFSFTPPPGTKHVELHSRTSGHGQAGGTGCAEFCTFTHQFTVNSTPFSHTYLTEKVLDRCATLVEEGVTPNQGGTWFFDRSSWCPGWVTEEWREDLTAASNLGGGENLVLFETGLGMDVGDTGGGNMNMRVELIYFE